MQAVNVNNKNQNKILLNLVINNSPVILLNKNSANICWWNSFAQLFAATRDLSIVNTMIGFINEHNNNCCCYVKCWYCNILHDFITIMTNSNGSINIDFNKYLFNIPAPVQDPKNCNYLIFHPFSVFEQYKQHDAFEGCNKWFEVIAKIAYGIYDMFTITMISEITCNKCNMSSNSNMVDEHALSISIEDNKINSIQDAINFFQAKELINFDCDITG